jgi:hypothetical protein
VGGPGVTFDGQAAFDIWSDGWASTSAGCCRAAGCTWWIRPPAPPAASGSVAGVTGHVLDIAILPAM